MIPIPFRSRVLLSLFVSFSLAKPSASNAATVPESVENLVEESLQTNPELAFYEAELEAALASRKTAGRLQPPNVNYSVGRRTLSSPGLRTEGRAWSLTISQKFEWPGRLGLRKAIANEEIALAELGLAAFKATLASEVRNHGYQLTAMERKAAIAGQVSDRYRELREVLIQRDSSGITPKLELRILEAAELGLRRRHTQALSEVTDARLELNHLLGRPLGDPLELNGSKPRFEPIPSISELIQAATSQNFSLQLQIVDIRKQGFQVSLAKNLQWPAFSVGPWVNEETGGGEDRIVGVALSFPLPLWKNPKSNVKNEEARLRQARVLLHTKQREVERDITVAALSLQAKLRELQHWHEDSITEFAEAATLADEHYRLGAVTATTYVEMQQQYLDAVATLVDTETEAVAAAARLEQLTQINLLR